MDSSYPEESLSVNAGPTDDKKHTITLSVPSDLIEDDSPTSLSLGFQVDSPNPGSEESYGVDDLKITSSYTCAKTQSPSATTGTPTSATTTGTPSGVPGTAAQPGLLLPVRPQQQPQGLHLLSRSVTLRLSWRKRL
ncbi:expressed unknown protein [Seminavis robusta]|uniref:Uncharacterized protein n=1 Tax=Seminavis robusta TaxID=568900 RepID=A0A9N8ET68_9STRA|nr:expressed unknown protein [Seminavis robusta]|eukprot:Sro1876_g303080.1 n/a (136) ;mRNA; r:9526-9933